MPRIFASSVVIFTLTLFASATLLFLIEPMIAKMILPKFGGTPAVWNTCMVFFQAVLLAGYAYAHAVTTWLPPRRQTVVQLVLLALPVLLLVLPVRVEESWAPKGEDYPVVWLLWLLVITLGLPFFVISTSAPLLSKWFASTGDPAARDPYFLYAASNVGSMVALFGYPLVVEPLLTLNAQSWIWAAGYVAFVGLTAWCAVRVWQGTAPAPALALAGGGTAFAESDVEDEVGGKAGVAVKKKKRKRRKEGREDARESAPPSAEQLAPAAPDLEEGKAPTLGRYLYWIILAAVPSSMMLAVTTYLTTDIASMPLLWVIPLGLYLLSFILVFSKPDALLDSIARKLDLRDVGVTNPLLPGFFGTMFWRARRFGLHQLMVLSMPVAVLLLVFLMISEMSVGWIGWAFLLHLSALFIVSMVCHGELARTRPATQYLTGYYLSMSVGGVVGGMFNALAAPLIFRSVAEYPIVLVVACLLLPPLESGNTSKVNFWIDIGLAVALGVGAAYALTKFLFGDEALRPWEADAGGQTWAALLCAGAVVLGLAVYAALSKQDRLGRWLDVGLPVALAILSAQLFLRSPFRFWNLDWLENALNIGSYRVIKVLTYGLPVALCYGFAERPWRFGMGVAALFLAGSLTSGLTNEKNLALHKHYVFHGMYPQGEVLRETVDVPLHQERSFFGVLKVEQRVSVARYNVRLDGNDEVLYRTEGIFTRLLHGTTLHGEQRRNPVIDELQAAVATVSPNGLEAAINAAAGQHELYDNRNEPLTYYHRTGPVGQVYAALCGGRPCDMAFIGLGTGTMASYVAADQHADFYEIDPAVVRIAADPRYFTYLRDCRGKYDIRLGDARLKLRDAAAHKYRLIVVDAFSSDAIPVHLITKEAVQLYFDKLEPDGMIAIHISNRHLDLAPVLGNIARELNKSAVQLHDNNSNYIGKNTSDWVVLANSPQTVAPLLDRAKATRQAILVNGVLGLFPANVSTPNVFYNYYMWKELPPKPGQSVWTDDFSNIVSVLNWWKSSE